MKKTLTVTIGIPAFNEEGNIGYLLRSLLEQNCRGFVLSKIIVSSDGSSDRTVQIVAGFKDKRIVLIDNKERAGQATRQNQIMEKTTTDCLILLNADIALDGEDFLQKLVRPVSLGEADLVSTAMRGLAPETIVEQIVSASLAVRNCMFEKWKKGQNLWTCHGAARAFSKKYYKKLRFKESIGEDAYSYLFCKFNGFKYRNVPRATCFIKLPDKFADHEKQAVRNILARKKFVNEFGQNFVEKEYRIPLKIVLSALVTVGIVSPIYTMLFLGFSAWNLIKAKRTGQISNIWVMAKSSKILVRAN